MFDPRMISSEHLHLALNHLPFLGAGFALVPLVVGFMTKSRAAVIAGLLIAVSSGWMIPLVMETGEGAYERLEKGTVGQLLDPQAEQFMELHEHRAEAWSVVLYANAVVSTLCLGLVFWKTDRLKVAATTSAGCCLAALVAGIWIAESGGKIRRPDFRENQAATQPQSSQRKHVHHDDD